jgi:hypothetical protein
MANRIGYTAETMRIASTLAASKKAREQVSRLLERMGEPTVYSGQRFDESQELADLLNRLDLDTYRSDSLPPMCADMAPGYRCPAHREEGK